MPTPLPLWPRIPAQPGESTFISAKSDRYLKTEIETGPFSEGGGGADARGFWVQRVDTESPETGAYSLRASHDEVVVQVPFSQQLQAMQRFLGYAYIDANNTTLRRVNPIAHGRHEFLRCRSITNVKGIGPRYDGHGTPEQLGSFSVTDYQASFPRPRYARYLKSQMTLNFETVPFACKSDDEVVETEGSDVGEWSRHTWIRPEPGFQALHIDGDQFQFDEGSVPASQKTFPNGRTVPLSVGRIMCTWFDVPLAFIQDSNLQYKNHNACINKINRTWFLGYPPNTLLCDIPKYDIRTAWNPDELDPNPYFIVDVTFTWHYLDPTPLGDGVTPVSTDPNAAYSDRGHNLAIYKGDRKWYPCSYVNPTTKKADNVTRIYQTYDFRDLFRKPTG